MGFSAHKPINFRGWIPQIHLHSEAWSTQSYHKRNKRYACAVTSTPDSETGAYCTRHIQLLFCFSKCNRWSNCLHPHNYHAYDYDGTVHTWFSFWPRLRLCLWRHLNQAYILPWASYVILNPANSLSESVWKYILIGPLLLIVGGRTSAQTLISSGDFSVFPSRTETQSYEQASFLSNSNL